MQKSVRERPQINTPRFISPMRPVMVPRLPEDTSKWLFEPKLDGYRAIAVKSAQTATLYSMDAKIFNQEFPEVLEALSKLMHKQVVLDGEVVAVEPSGRPNFNALQNRRSTKLAIQYIVFDCLNFKGRDLLGKPLEERKKYLSELAPDLIPPMQLVFTFPSDIGLETAIITVKRLKIEGLVAKQRNSLYYPGREVDVWQKHRFNLEGKFFIGGYIPGPRGVSELLIGEYGEDGKLHFVKRLTAGLNQFNRPEIFKKVQDLKTAAVPFVNLPEKKSRHQHPVDEEVMAQSVWVKPEQPLEVEFVERTPHGRLRHASFRRLLPRTSEK